jgi:hypothetical protein
MSFTLTAGATATGLNRTTILRAIKSGKISGAKDEHGEWHIEPVARTETRSDATPQHAPGERRGAAHTRNASGGPARRPEGLARSQRDHWQTMAQHLAITDQRPTAPLLHPRQWWQRLAGIWTPLPVGSTART